MLNLFITIYYGYNMPKQNRLLNLTETFNEMLIQLVSINMFLFTDFVLSEDVKYMVGYCMIFQIVLILIFNLSFVFYFGLRVAYS